MARAPRPCSPKDLQTKAEQLAARDAVMKIVLEHLAQGRASLPELLVVVGGHRSTLVGYMLHMHKKRRTIRPTTQRRNKALLWELGADPSLPSEDDLLDRLFAPKRGIAPARQLGMRRDPLIAAFFGPAQVAAGAAA